jgi:hypothetical protein
MSDPTANATVMVAQGSTAVTWEVATILSEALSRLGITARVEGAGTAAGGVPIIIFGQGATTAPQVPRAQARRAIILLLAGPGTQAFSAAAGLAEDAAGCFAVSPRTVEALSIQGIRVDRFVLGHADRWDSGGAANRTRSIDIVHTGEVDGPGRSALARVAPELAEMHPRIDLIASGLAGPAAPSAFESSALLADARLTLSLNRWRDTTLDWPTVVRAMCNGSVVIAERATGYGELLPGGHFLMTRGESLGPVIRAAAADPQALADMAAAAYEFCRTELAMAMNESLERLAAAAGRSRFRLPVPHRRAQPAVAPSAGSSPQRLEFKAVGPLGEAPDAGAEIDVLCVDHREAGPISLTRDSLAGHSVRVNLHVATIKITEHHRGSLPARCSEPIGTSIAEARNDLVRRSSAPLVMFIDSGDEILGTALGRLIAALQSSESDICMPIVALGAEDLAYPPLCDSPQSAADGEGLQRGYIVRRSYLDRIGPFTGGDDGAGGVDRAFWRRATAVGGCVALLPRVGLRLWRQTQAG